MAEKLFAPDTPLGKALMDFWRSLNEDRQTRAQLRQADSVTEVIMVPGTHRLLHALRAAAREQGREGLYLGSGAGRVKVAVIAGLLAHVKTSGGANTAVLMAQRKKTSDTPYVSELRFRRLIQAGDIESLYPMLRRTLALMDHHANVHALAADIWFWGDHVRRQWAYDYYDKLPSRQGAA